MIDFLTINLIYEKAFYKKMRDKYGYYSEKCISKRAQISDLKNRLNRLDGL